MTNDTLSPSARDVTPISVEQEMRRSYLDYAMSVIVSRALPDIRDGLKPVHRRILFGMKEGGYTSDKQYRKCARVVGDIIGKYHPHGESAVYDALVRMTQDFSMSLTLLDGQGNFGSMDGDPPAAQRYTEVRLDHAGEALLADIDLDTVDFKPNYDESEHEPVVVPARYPNLLVNGAGGIAVGMATNIPTHNLNEVIDACVAYMDNNEISVDGLMEFLPGPDFPTGGILLGNKGARDAYHTGRGSITIRGRSHFEESGKDRTAIVIDEIPYQINKARMIEIIAHASRDKKIEGISELRDESNRDGVRVVIDVRRDSTPEIVLNQLYKFSPLQTNFGINMVGLHEGRPGILDLKKCISAFISFREVVVTRRTRHLLEKARDRAQTLVGLAIAVSNIDEVVKLIRSSPDPSQAREKLMKRAWDAKKVEDLLALIDDPTYKINIDDGTYKLNESQARGILELRLQRLTALEQDKIAEELEGLSNKIKGHLELLSSRELLNSLIKSELAEAKESFGVKRRTEIGQPADLTEYEDLIEREDVAVSVSHSGYIKRTPLSTYRAQRRGGKGRTGMSTREEDFVSKLFVANTHDEILFFSSLGKVYKTKTYRLPAAGPASRGKAMVNLLPLSKDEIITTVMPWPSDSNDGNAPVHLFFTTLHGNVRRNSLVDFERINSGGKIAISLADGDRLIGVSPCSEDDDALLAARGGKCIRFPVTAVRLFKGRSSSGVRGMRLKKGDEVISLTLLKHVDLDVETRNDYLKAISARRRLSVSDYDNRVDDKTRDTQLASKIDDSKFSHLSGSEQFLLSVTENGYGKRTLAYEYRTIGRGGQGIVNIETSPRNGKVIASFPVENDDEIVLMSNRGRIIRLPVHDIRVAGRNTQGVTLFNTEKNEKVVSVALVEGGANETENNQIEENSSEIDSPIEEV